MTTPISRRDFLNGAALAVGSGLVSPMELLAAAPAPATHYPPTLTGLRGSHPGSLEVAHALAWRGERPADYRARDEHYDLAIVGAGISGLAAAWFWRRQRPDARILLLDNHDDFGGHARRNEFHEGGRMVLGIGGAQNLENHGAYSDVALGLLAELGIDEDVLDAVDAATPQDFALGGRLEAKNALSLVGPRGRVTVGGNWLQTLHAVGDYRAALNTLPLAADERARLIDFVSGSRDLLDDLSLSEKYRYAETVAYNRFLADRVGLSRQSIGIFDSLLRQFYGFTGWNLSLLEAFYAGAAGLRSVGWLGRIADSALSAMGPDLMNLRMFPDGNATVARSLVRGLVPHVAAGSAFDDIARARFDYGRLDGPEQSVRIRLSSTVVGVRQADQGVVVEYVHEREPQRVAADHCVLACYNGIIPHLCPQLPDAQKEALRYGVKTPLVYANVLLRDGRAFAGLGASYVSCPDDPFVAVSAAPPISVAGYEAPRGPEDPMAVFMVDAPTPAPTQDEPLRDLLRQGRAAVYGTSFAEYERRIRDQLQGLLGPHGFDHERDIRAITVNRHAHGYAYGYTALNDPPWPEGEAPHEIGRRRFGRISIANSDSEARAYLDAAVDAAWRATQEQLAS